MGVQVPHQPPFDRRRIRAGMTQSGQPAVGSVHRCEQPRDVHAGQCGETGGSVARFL